MQVPEDLRYTDEHEWIRATDSGVRIGITDYAQDQLGDVVFVELPEVGAEVTAGDTLAEVESTKSVAEVYAPMAGRVASVNSALTGQPELVNSSPYDEGWFVELETEKAELEGFLAADAYRDLTE